MARQQFCSTVASLCGALVLAAAITLAPAIAAGADTKNSGPAPKPANQGNKAPAGANARGAAGHPAARSSPAAGGRPAITTNSAQAHGGALAGGRPGENAPPPASAFGGHPAPGGSHVQQASNGAFVRTRADGSHSDIHDAQHGMDIHHSLGGARQISVERADHSRVVSNGRGGGYVQHPFTYRGHEFGHRTYWDHGRAYDHYYRRYPYYGHYYDVYAPYRYYPYGYYYWAYNPWVAPAPYAWAWAGSPWYGYYGAYYVAAPVYVGPSYWLADYMLAASLQAAYAAQAGGAVGAAPELPGALMASASQRLLDLLISPSEAAATNPPALTPEIKALLAAELQLAIHQEGEDAKASAQSKDGDAPAAGVARLFDDGKPHVFLIGQDLDLVDAAGTECAVSPGDVIQVATAPPTNATNVDATILASKGTKECAAADRVTVTLADLQEMQNHLRAGLDDGLAELQAKQGQGGIPAAPADTVGQGAPAAFASAAPPADANPNAEIQAQVSQANQVENETLAGLAPTPTAAAVGPASQPATIAVGQSIAQVTAALGTPTRVIDLGVKKIYAYPDMKVIFVSGKVVDVQ